jgi:hypothetical protein
MKIIIGLLIVAMLVLVGCGPKATVNPPSEIPKMTDNEKMVESVMQDEMMVEVDSTMFDGTEEYTHAGLLSPVDGSSSSGLAEALFMEGKYMLRAEMANLPDPDGTDFYEGWIVRKGLKFDVISTGKLEKVDDNYLNFYVSKQNLIDHSFYVLTLESDDGNPAPAAHVLEGTLVPVEVVEITN